MAIRAVLFDADDVLSGGGVDDRRHTEAIAAVAALAGRYTLGLVSDAPVDRSMGIGGTVDFRLAADDVGIARSDPRLFRAAAAAASCHPSELVVVCSRVPGDLDAPMAAGCRGIWLGSPGAPVAASCRPDAVLVDLSGLPAVLARFDEEEAQAAGSVGVGPHPIPWPPGDHLDPELLASGDRRNVVDRYRYWREDAIVADLARHRHRFHVAVENWRHDRNIGAVVRNANAFGAAAVHIVGRRRWNRRGAMATDRYLTVRHHDAVESFVAWAGSEDLPVVGFDNVAGAVPLESVELPERCVLLFGQEGPGLSAEALAGSAFICAITQYGSTRSLNAGVASGIAMHAWTGRHGGVGWPGGVAAP